MKKEAQKLSRRQREAAHAQRTEEATLEELAARETAIQGRPTFGTYLSKALTDQASELGLKSDSAANILAELSQDEIVLASRRGDGIRDYVMQAALEKASIPMKPYVKMAVDSAIDQAIEAAGPSGHELMEQLHGELGLGGGPGDS